MKLEIKSYPRHNTQTSEHKVDYDNFKVIITHFVQHCLLLEGHVGILIAAKLSIKQKVLKWLFRLRKHNFCHKFQISNLNRYRLLTKMQSKIFYMKGEKQILGGKTVSSWFIQYHIKLVWNLNLIHDEPINTSFKLNLNLFCLNKQFSCVSTRH